MAVQTTWVPISGSILGQLIDEHEENGRKIILLAKPFVTTGQHAVDFAQATRNVLRYGAPSGINFDPETAITGFQRANDEQRRIINSIGTISQITAVTTASSIGLVMAPFADEDVVVEAAPLEHEDDARKAAQQLASVLGQIGTQEEVVNLLGQMAFRKRHDKLDPIHQFQTAWGAFETPVTPYDPANSSLIPMRQCIIAVIDDLLQRRPTQEKTPNEFAKIMSIGRQVGAADYDKDHWHGLAEQWQKEIEPNLSGSKTKPYSRLKWANDLQSATLFLKTLVLSIDWEKLRA